MTWSRYGGSLAVWAGLLAYASLYPFYPLRLPSPDALPAFFAAPRYLIRSDIAFNVVAYVPLGTLACLYLRGRGARWPILGAAGLGAAQFNLVNWTQDLDGTTGYAGVTAESMFVSGDFSTAVGTIIGFNTVTPVAGRVKVDIDYYMTWDGLCNASVPVFVVDGAPTQLAFDRVGRVPAYRLAAAAAVQLCRAREHQLEVVVQLGHRADRGARGAHRVGLVDGDGRRDALDRVDLRLVHAVEELARVGAEGLDVAPLPLGVQRVEDERGLARARHTGDDDQLARGQRERQVLEVVLARAANDDGVGRGMLGLHGSTGEAAILSDADGFIVRAWIRGASSSPPPWRSRRRSRSPRRWRSSTSRA